jgi:hypothetical protein
MKCVAYMYVQELLLEYWIDSGSIEIRYGSSTVPEDGTVLYRTVLDIFIFLFFYNLLVVDRGCRPLLEAYHRCPHL